MTKRQVKYLVSLATTWNDIPVQLFDSLAEARRFTETFNAEEALPDLCDLIMSDDVGDSISLCIFGFRDGKPFRCESHEEIKGGFFSEVE